MQELDAFSQAEGWERWAVHKGLAVLCQMPSKPSHLHCSFFPPALFGNDLVSSIINHLATIVAQLNPLSLLWDQPQGRGQVSSKCIREKADREPSRAGVGGDGLAVQHSPFPGSCESDTQGRESGKVCHANSLFTHPTGQIQEGAGVETVSAEKVSHGSALRRENSLHKTC